jgi:hypothetical protein
MVETFTPAVCGSRRRQRLALAGFALGAVAASALVGASLGAVGALLGTQLAFVVAALALLAAAREAGIVRLPLPQLRRQVPERWASSPFSQSQPSGSPAPPRSHSGSRSPPACASPPTAPGER